MSREKSQEGSEGEKKEESKPKPILTRFGIDEVVYMRPAKKGKYTPTIHEVEDLIINGLVTYTEYRVLLFIKKKTVNFWNTEVRLKRRDIQETLKISKKQCGLAIHSLIANSYLMEKEDKDDYYFYGLNPYTFDGIFIVKTVEHGACRINKNLKPITLLESLRLRTKGVKSTPNGVEKVSQWSQKVTEWESKRLPKADSTAGNYSGFEMLKYTLLKYTYLNGFSEARGEMILSIIQGIKNPEYLIKQFVGIIQTEPKYGRAITDEMIRADTAKTDAFQKTLRTNALNYIVTCWPELKKHFHNVPHPNLDTSPEMCSLRKELADLIAEYPIEMKEPAPVIPLKVGEKG